MKNRKEQPGRKAGLFIGGLLFGLIRGIFSRINTEKSGSNNMFNKKKITWDEIVLSYTKNPRDVKTVPLRKEGIWFYVFAENNDLYVTNANNHIDSSKIKTPRKIDKENFVTMLSIYAKRKNGESVTQEAIDITYNQVYWYGIFADMGL